MKRRHALLAGFSVFSSGCLDTISEPDTQPTDDTETVLTYDCDAATRPPSPAPDTGLPGDTKRYGYPDQPASLANEEIRSYVKRYERAYTLNKLRARYEVRLAHTSVHIEEVTFYDAPDESIIAQVTYTYDAEIEGDDGPIEMNPPLLYAAYYVDDDGVLRAVDPEHQEEEAGLLVDPMEQGELVECF